MSGEAVLFAFFLIFTGAAACATIALFTRQSLLVAYIFLGAVLGPYGMGCIDEPTTISQISTVGIIFLLFLLGLNLQPQNLVHLLSSTTMVTGVSSIIFTIAGFMIALAFQFPVLDSLVIGVASIFSSTIIGLKLLPTTVLHHQRMGEVVVSVLLLQDLIAIVMMTLFNVNLGEHFSVVQLISILFALPALILFCFITERYVLRGLLIKFDKIQEYIFLLAIGWCLGVAQLAETMQLSLEIGALIAGVTIASSPIALFIAESLKPLRDFFLVLFFFSLGASFNFDALPYVWLAAMVLGVTMLLLKPGIFWAILRKTKESGRMALEIGIRLGHLSEFSLLIAHMAKEKAIITAAGSYLIQVATVITFIVSSYTIVRYYPTPIAIDEKLRRD